MSYFETSLHPDHASLLSNQHSLRSLLHQYQDRIDPYYEIDGTHICSSVNSPRFNISETETSYILDGEFPGLADKNAISVEWMQNQVLIIGGNTTLGTAATLIDHSRMA
jgi:HSP20 family molecular chaperone IbpA